MSDACSGEVAPDDRRVPPRTTLDWLALAASPTFAGMALLTGVQGEGSMICSAMPGASPLTGMAAMYLLMSLFHATPWLRLLAQRRGA